MYNVQSVVGISALVFASSSIAENISPVILTPTDSLFSATPNTNPSLYPNLTFEPGAGDGPDIWTFNLGAFDTDFFVSTTVELVDFCCHADDYELYWDGELLGNTGAGIIGLFEFDTTAEIHALEIIWLNPIEGGSFYNISIEVALGDAVVPVPAAIWLFGSGLFGLIGLARRKKI